MRTRVRRSAAEMGPRSAWIAQRLAHWANQSPWGRQLSKPLLKSSGFCLVGGLRSRLRTPEGFVEARSAGTGRRRRRAKPRGCRANPRGDATLMARISLNHDTGPFHFSTHGDENPGSTKRSGDGSTLGVDRAAIGPLGQPIPVGTPTFQAAAESSSPSKRIAIEPESRCEANRLHVQSHGWKGGFPDASDGRQTVLSNANTKVRDEENKVIEPI